MFRPSSIGLFCIVASVLAGEVLADETVDQIQQAIIAYRSQITHGTLRTKTIVEVDSGGDREGEEVTFDIAFSGSDVRSDRYQVNGVKGQRLSFGQRRIIANGQFVYEETSKNNVPVEVGKKDAATSVAKDDLFDPAVCGLVLAPIARWDKYDLGDAVRVLGAEAPVIRTEQVDGQDVLAISWKRVREGESQEFAARICPEKGYAVLKEEFSTTAYRRALDARYTESFGIWFPSTLTYEEATEGRVGYRETTSLDADFAKQVDPSLFTLASLGISAGRHVRVSGEHMIWDGARLIPEPKSEAMDTRGPPEARSRWLLVTNAIVLAVLACLLLLKWFRKPRQP